MAKDARELLETQGYFVGNLWHINDVMDRFECAEEDAQYILEQALTNPWIVESIHNTIRDIAIGNGLKEKDNNQ